MFRYLTDLGNHCNLFYTQIKTRGRPPSGYAQLDLADPEQFTLAIIKIITKQQKYGLALNQPDIAHTFLYKPLQDF
jgi:hypothetical protein